MKRKEVYRCNSFDYSRKEYGECQSRYSGYHSVSVKLVFFQIPHINDDDAQYGQKYDSDSNTGYEYQNHPENNTSHCRIRNILTELSHAVTETDHV